MENPKTKFRRPLLQGALAIAATAMIAAPAPAPAATFLRLGDIKGEATDAKHKDHIEILSFTQSWVNEVALHGEGGGSIGKVQCGAITLMKNIDKSSPMLLKGVATGQNFGTAVISFQAADAMSARAPATDYFTITLGTVFVTELSQTDEKDPNRIFEKLVLKAKTYEFKYTPITKTGAVGQPVVFSYDCESLSGG